MSPARTLAAIDYRALKSAARRLVDLLGGQTAAAKDTRLDQVSLSRALSPSNEWAERFLPLDVVADLERAAGDPEVTRELARQMHCVLVPEPRVKASAGDVAGLCKMIGESSEAAATIAAASADRSITSAERADIIAKLNDAVAASLELREFYSAQGGSDE